MELVKTSSNVARTCTPTPVKLHKALTLSHAAESEQNPSMLCYKTWSNIRDGSVKLQHSQRSCIFPVHEHVQKLIMFHWVLFERTVQIGEKDVKPADLGRPPQGAQTDG